MLKANFDVGNKQNKLFEEKWQTNIVWLKIVVFQPIKAISSVVSAKNLSVFIKNKR